mmetsp:Transcript_49006/g.59114  ORF Transcript_49006/g.59114 Transcript_49006/m.59114 type:complete len:274 (-) Transcript_49006:613-1434(-)
MLKKDFSHLGNNDNGRNSTELNNDHDINRARNDGLHHISGTINNRDNEFLKKMKLITVGTAIILLSVLITMSVLVSLQSASGDGDTSSATGGFIGSSATFPPTMQPTGSMSSGGGGSSSIDGRSSRFNEALVILTSISDKDALLDESTPQHSAMVWIADIDSRQIPLHMEKNERREQASVANDGNISQDVIQRYVMAVLYYSTNKNYIIGSNKRGNWIHEFGFLSTDHECEWNGGEDAVEVDGGVEECNENLRIARIDLGKLCVHLCYLLLIV